MATCTIRALITSYIFCFSRLLILLLVFAPYVFSGGTLSLSGYIVVLSLAEKLCNTVMVLFSGSLLYGAEMLVAVARIRVKNVMYSLVNPFSLFRGLLTFVGSVSGLALQYEHKLKSIRVQLTLRKISVTI